MKKNRAICLSIAGIFCLLATATVSARAAPGPASARPVPVVAGPSIRVDFTPSYLEKWLESRPPDFEQVVIPRRDGTGWAGATAGDAWTEVPVLGPLVRPEPRTEFRAFYSGEALFFRARNWFDPEKPPEAEWRERNEPRYIWNEEMVDIRLRVPPVASGADPEHPGDRAGSPVYQFVVNAAGAVHDTRDGNWEYRAEWQAKVETREDHWILWVMIPFAALELESPVPEFEIMIGRGGPEADTLSWGPEWTDTSFRGIALEGVSREPAPQKAIDDKTKEGDAPGRAVCLEWITGFARPQDRWVEGFVQLGRAPAGPGTYLEVALRAPGGGEPLETVVVEPESDRGRIRVDLRRFGLDSGLVSARLTTGGERPREVFGGADSVLEAAPLPPAPAPGFRVPLVVDVPEGPGPEGPWALYAGVPFPAGLLWSADGWVVEDAAGVAYPTQLEASGLWARDGSIKWLRVESVADPRGELFLAYRPGLEAPAAPGAVSARREGQRVFLSSGAVEYELSAAGSPIAAVRRDGQLVAGAEGARGLYLVDQRGRTAVATGAGAEILVESSGPVAGCVRIEGDYATDEGEVLARHITRVEVFAGELPARVTHTLVLTRDTNEVWFREAGWELALAPGASPEVFYGISREDPGAYRRVAGAGDSYLVQESYYRFGTGEKRFRLFAGGQEVLAGEEMGDWFLAQNAGAGLAWSCRETARQHPKEFAVRGDLVNLVLYSPRAGEELDFRGETLVERWNLRNWITNDGWDDLPGERRAAVEREIDQARGVYSNAAGWAKTHHLAFSSSPGPRPAGAAAAEAAWHSRPVFALADPAWTWRSGAMGPLHPRDPERFPEAERLVDAALDWYASRVPEFGEWGFVDYQAGPHFHNPGSKYPRRYRYGYTYTLRPDAWRALARSGRREAFEFATATNRSFGDNYLASWDDPGRIKGLYTRGLLGTLPFYWGSGTQTNIQSSTNLEQFLLDYYLTGYRRAADQLRDYASGVKRRLTPQAVESEVRGGRALMTLRCLHHCYSFTWDGELRELAGAIADAIEDPAGSVGLTKERRYRSSTYKLGPDIRAILEAWELLGEPRYHRLSRLVGEFVWQRGFGSEPIAYTSAQGIAGHFLFGETGDPGIAQSLLVQMRRASAHFDPDRPGHGLTADVHAATSFFESIPAMQDVVARTGADRRPAASWAAARDFGNPVDFVFFKPDGQSARLYLKTPGGTGQSRMEALEPPTGFGLETMRSVQDQTGFTLWSAPIDAPEAAFRVTPGESGEHYAVASGRFPLVIHAPGYWVPWPPQDPPARWYFRVPEGADRPALFLEGAARVHGPDGRLWLEKGSAPGWLELPAERAGLWSFEPLEPRLVRLRNLPPFFAAESPEKWFDPGIEWHRKEAAEPFEPPAETGFTEGVSGRPGDRALYVARGGSFGFDGGQPRAEEGAGTEFLPFHEGTIEFWLRPAWGTFDFPAGERGSRRLARVLTDGRAWEISYLMDYTAGATEFTSHVLYAIGYAQSPERSMNFRSWRRQTIFEPGEWVHVALTWGPRVRPTALGPRRQLTIRTFVNGRGGSQHGTDRMREGFLPADTLRRLVFSGTEAAIDHLRVSDIMRYTEDFDPPGRMSAPEVDRHTRAYFSFDGTLEGVSGDGRAISGEITP